MFSFCLWDELSSLSPQVYSNSLCMKLNSSERSCLKSFCKFQVRKFQVTYLSWIKMLSQSVINNCKPAHYLQTAYQYVFANLSLLSYMTVCSYQSLKENSVNAAKLPFNALQNFLYCVANYHLCSWVFFSLAKLWRKIALCPRELSLNTTWNFTVTFFKWTWKSRRNKTKGFFCLSSTN